MKPPDLQEWLAKYGEWWAIDWEAWDKANLEYQNRRREELLRLITENRHRWFSSLRFKSPSTHRTGVASMDMREHFPSQYITAADLQGKDVTLVMKYCEEKEMTDGKRKPVIYFERTEKGLVLNKTNMETISDMYGYDNDNWWGKPITLFPDRVDFQGKRMDAIRIRFKRIAKGVTGGVVHHTQAGGAEGFAPVNPPPRESLASQSDEKPPFDDDPPF